MALFQIGRIGVVFGYGGCLALNSDIDFLISHGQVYTRIHLVRPSMPRLLGNACLLSVYYLARLVLMTVDLAMLELPHVVQLELRVAEVLEKIHASAIHQPESSIPERACQLLHQSQNGICPRCASAADGSPKRRSLTSRASIRRQPTPTF